MEDIVAGLCFAVARNFIGCIARGRNLIPPVSFQGGVAANKGMVRAFRETFGLEELFIPEDFALIGAIGAALKNRDEGVPAAFDLMKFKEFLQAEKATEEGYAPLSDTNIPSPPPGKGELRGGTSLLTPKPHLSPHSVSRRISVSTSVPSAPILL